VPAFDAPLVLLAPDAPDAPDERAPPPVAPVLSVPAPYGLEPVTVPASPLRSASVVTGPPRTVMPSFVSPITAPRFGTTVPLPVTVPPVVTVPDPLTVVVVVSMCPG